MTGRKRSVVRNQRTGCKKTGEGGAEPGAILSAGQGQTGRRVTILPRVYGQFLAFLFYRWEVILRETSILGIRTLGFSVDSAMATLRLDRILALIQVAAVLNIGVDAFSRTLRARLRLSRVAGEV